MTPAEILDEANFAAKEAAKLSSIKNPDVLGACGAVWITVRPARGPFVSHLKSIGNGERGDYGGWYVDFDCGYRGQNSDVKYDAAKAFVDVLRKNGIRASANQRLT
jgi:hypothetical protein